MTTNDSHVYAMTLSLNVLNHLGIGLYSNVPAVLSEAIANAWDADATRVSIDIDIANRRIVIQDDGHGMTVADANGKYLTVGYERRADGGAKTPGGRSVMGRKGIGKLSLFSIAGTVEVHSMKDGERHGFRMNIADIKDSATDGDIGKYYPDPVDPTQITLIKGTCITLSDMKRRLHQTGAPLRQRLARRFSIIGANQDFSIVLDGRPVTIADRGYHDKLQYIWPFGQKGEEIATISRNVEHKGSLPSAVKVGNNEYNIDGWIGTARKPSDLKDRATGESINGIVVMVRGKLAQENILDEFGDENLYSEYVIGEVHADFLDLDDQEDIATSSRQRLIEDDQRYRALKYTLGESLKKIHSGWRGLRNDDGLAVATTMMPQIETWYQSLHDDHKKAAKNLFGKINQLKIDTPEERGQLFISSILAFESLKLRNLINRIDEISPANLGVLRDVFMQLDDLEASAYYQITRDRLEVIKTFQDIVDDDELEKVLQAHLYDHLWLLDPSWERAAKTEYMEQQIRHALLGGIDVDLTENEKLSRVDIGYTTTGNKHVIIELKRASRQLSTANLVAQIEKYYNAASKVLQQTGKGDEPLEFVCVIGRPLTDWSSHDGVNRSRNTLDGNKTRVVMYQQLIENAAKAYNDYTVAHRQAGRVYELIKTIEESYVQAIRASETDVG